ncbi:MAG TPA: hypothetical protein VHP36_01420 [Chitinispirillaceae bacterium]|nr:hypothetical protein [Chitinispirillaceae bacterium]
MRTIPFKFISVFLLVWLPAFEITVLAQELDTGSESGTQKEDGTDPFGGDPFGGMINQDNNEIEWDLPDDPQESPQLQNGSSSSSSTTPSDMPENKSGTDSYQSSEIQESVVQNAIIEGIQITTEQGQIPDEKLVSVYFIFRDKPTSYFWEIKSREKKLVFEFHDTKTGSSPVASVSEAPIKGFNIEEGKIDINKDIRGLKPEYRDRIKVIFDLEAVPEIHVNDEFSIISFSYKWTTDLSKIDKYTVKDNTKKIILLSSAGVGVVGIGALVYYLATKPEPPAPLGILPDNDLPNHALQE